MPAIGCDIPWSKETIPMSRFRRVSPILTSLTVLCFPASSVRAAYIVTDIATLNTEFPQQLSINNLGQVAFTNGVGTSFVNQPSHGYLYSNGITIDLGGLGGSPINSTAAALNDTGQVVGSSTLPGGASHASLYSNGTVKDLGVLGTNPAASSVATGINAAGQIAGWSNPNPSLIYVQHAFLYANGVMKDLGVLGGKIAGQAATYSFAYGINAAGQVVGSSGWLGNDFIRAHAFLYAGGVMKDLGVLGQFVFQGLTYSNSSASAINAAGQVVGYSSTSSGYHAFLYSGGAMKDLGTLGSFQTPLGTMSGSGANAINSLGQVVGDTSTSSGSSAFLYQNGHMQDLNALLPPSSRWRIIDAVGINDKGQIVAYAMDSGWLEHIVELTPQGSVAAAPEPGSLALGLLGLAALVGYRFRRIGRAFRSRCIPL